MLILGKWLNTLSTLTHTTEVTRFNYKCIAVRTKYDIYIRQCSKQLQLVKNIFIYIIFVCLDTEYFELGKLRLFYSYS